MGENCSLYYSLQAYLAPETSLPRGRGINKYFSRSQKKGEIQAIRDILSNSIIRYIPIALTTLAQINTTAN